MAQKNRKCFCCGKNYSYCPDCSRADALKESWHSEFCSETCMTLWTTLTKFGMKYLTKAEAKEIISSLDLKPIDSYVACVKRDYAVVMAEEKKLKRAHKKVEPIIEEVPEVVVEDTAEHEVVLKEEDNKAL